MTFDEIVNSISFEELKRTLTEPKNQDALINIVYVARAIAAVHPGWEKWDEDPKSCQMKKRFMKAIEKFYNAQSALNEPQRLKGKSLAKELYKVVGLLNDNHLEIFYGKDEKGNPCRPIEPSEKIKYRPDPKGSVGENVAYQYTHSDENTRLFHLGTDDDHRPIVIARRMTNGQPTGIIGLTTFLIHHGTDKQFREEHAFREVVNILKKNLNTVDNIIIDVRGNRGGIIEALEEIAEVIYGEKPTLCSECGYRTTKEAKFRESYSKSRLLKSGPKKQYTGKQKLFVLTDKETASFAEYVYPIFQQYEKTQFIGENTRGCCQCVSNTPILLPCGGTLCTGRIFCNFWDGPVEGIGFRPDINCSGRDAFQVALEQIEGQKNTLKKTLSEGKKEGKSVFPRWLQNPSWLWHRGRKQK